MENKETKTVYYEWLRLIACFLVIFNHLKGYVLYQNASGIKQICYMTISVITKINVPLFFMVSGALLLEKQEDIAVVFKKRVSRVCLVILLFSLGIYTECYLYALSQGREYVYTARRFFRGVIANDLDETGAYWYLYAYLGFLLLLPLFQKLAKRMGRNDFLLLFGLHFAVLSAFPLGSLFLQITGNESLLMANAFSVSPATTAAFFYPLAGYYIDRKIDLRIISKREWTGLFAAAFGGVLLSCFCVSLDGMRDGDYLSLFDYLLATVAFLAVKYIVTIKRPALSAGKTARVVCFCGSLTFGIYLLDHYFKLILYNGYEAMAERFMPSLFASFGWCAVSMVLGGSVTWILKKLPLFRKLL